MHGVCEWTTAAIAYDYDLYLRALVVFLAHGGRWDLHHMLKSEVSRSLLLSYLPSWTAL